MEDFVQKPPGLFEVGKITSLNLEEKACLLHNMGTTDLSTDSSDATGKIKISC